VKWQDNITRQDDDSGADVGRRSDRGKGSSAIEAIRIILRFQMTGLALYSILVASMATTSRVDVIDCLLFGCPRNAALFRLEAIPSGVQVITD
jgi:hypothetical protein